MEGRGGGGSEIRAPSRYRRRAFAPLWRVMCASASIKKKELSGCPSQARLCDCPSRSSLSYLLMPELYELSYYARSRITTGFSFHIAHIPGWRNRNPRWVNPAVNIISSKDIPRLRSKALLRLNRTKATTNTSGVQCDSTRLGHRKTDSEIRYAPQVVSQNAQEPFQQHVSAFYYFPVRYAYLESLPAFERLCIRCCNLFLRLVG